MKKLILAATILAVAAMGVQSAKAGDREWATVGKVLTGVAAVSIIANALDARPAHASVTYTYAAPAPVVCAPAPVIYTPAPVVYARPPIIYVPAPRPVVVVNRGFHGHNHHFGHHRR